MATVNDNRIQFPPTEVDFDGVVGTTGQDHDTFPAPGQPPRFDWMRSVIIGLLANQSSDDPPTQYRVGTLWFNRTKQALFIWDGSAFVSVASHIAMMESTDGTILSLADWFLLVQDKLESIQPRITFSGYCLANNAQIIPVPEAVRDEIEYVYELLHPLVYINGMLVDPRLTSFSVGCPTSVVLRDPANLSKDDRFTVIVERFDLEHTDDVVVGP